ncbi:helix-turn-helix domain-containing protein [Chryseobacterium sp. GVT01B]|uniref:helix-turn-helix domain-containing protein n=1 Tax=Chryseobacterium sp. GVT01B TaxID=2862675 RepID=UPI001CBE260E|nr:helix-turn-helix domain-containing protein [Chryseobacterium sp. GVT01B]
MKNQHCPDYSKIYSDIIESKYPEKKQQCVFFLNKEKLTAMDVLKLNTLIFGNEADPEATGVNQFRSYDQETIRLILEYQIKNNLNNLQTAKHFRISRNSLAKWKKMKNQQKID